MKISARTHNTFPIITDMESGGITTYTYFSVFPIQVLIAISKLDMEELNNYITARAL